MRMPECPQNHAQLPLITLPRLLLLLLLLLRLRLPRRSIRPFQSPAHARGTLTRSRKHPEFLMEEPSHPAAAAVAAAPQAERQRIEKAKAKWKAEAEKRRKEADARRRAQQEEEKRALREKKEAEEGLLA